jgi:hypothetical protein
METKIKWNEGEGYITATYEGSGNGSASISSDVNEGIDREQSIKVETTDKSVSATLVVSQEGLREEFVTSDGKVFMTADGEVFGVLKHVEYVNPILTDYLTFVALEDGFTASLSLNACEYCVDGDGNWKTLAVGASTEAINTGQTLSFRGTITPVSTNGIGTFSLKKKCKIQGDAKSMLFGDDAKNNTSLAKHQYAFMSLFYNNPNLIEVADNVLTATTMSLSCYRRMFQSCTGMVRPPSILPAMELDQYCYRDMFRNCSAMTESPILPAKTLKAYCYSYMYYYCTALNKITALFTTLSPSTATNTWVTGVAKTGTFIKATDATWTTTGVNGVPNGWTIIKEG